MGRVMSNPSPTRARFGYQISNPSPPHYPLKRIIPAPLGSGTHGNEIEKSRLTMTIHQVQSQEIKKEQKSYRNHNTVMEENR
ncbi:hypothetical protein LXL04_014679 [Taraxacum kok-saghyz]